MSELARRDQFELSQLGRVLDTGVDLENIPARQGFHIELLEDGGFRVLSGRSGMSHEELQRIQAVAGKQRELSPVVLEVDQDALERWGEDLIQQAFIRRAVALALKLELVKADDGFLSTTEIVRRIQNHLNDNLDVTDMDGETVTLLNLFANNREGCIAALMMGLFTLVIGRMKSAGLKTAFAEEVFNKAAIKLGIQVHQDANDYETALQLINRSKPLQQWLNPTHPESLLEEIETILDNHELRDEEIEFLNRAALALLDGVLQDELMDSSVLKPGRVVVMGKNVEATDADPEHIKERLANDSALALEFIRYIMSTDSDMYLLDYLRWRLGYTERVRLPAFDEDGNLIEEEVDGNS